MLNRRGSGHFQRSRNVLRIPEWVEVLQKRKRSMVFTEDNWKPLPLRPSWGAKTEDADGDWNVLDIRDVDRERRTVTFRG